MQIDVTEQAETLLQAGYRTVCMESDDPDFHEYAGVYGLGELPFLTKEVRPSRTSGSSRCVALDVRVCVLASASAFSSQRLPVCVSRNPCRKRTNHNLLTARIAALLLTRS